MTETLPPLVMFGAPEPAAPSFAVRDPARGLDDIAKLAASLCHAPIALVSLVRGTRICFEARVGYETEEAELDSAICRFVLKEDDILIIPDLKLDARTCLHPLVTAERSARFYAGAPLQAPSGQVVGSLCVIDREPRPDGLTAEEATNLRSLARQVVDQLELRRALATAEEAETELTIAQRRLEVSEAHWRGLFEQLQEGMILGEVIRDGDGRIVDWRYVEVNRAFAELVGRQPEEVIGHTIQEVFPDIESSWIDLAQVVDGGQPVSFTDQVGQLGRWYDGRSSALDDKTFVVLFLDVTAERQAEQALVESGKRRIALAELGDCLRSTLDAAAMAHTTGAILGRTLKAQKAGYGTVDARQETIEVLSDWTAPGERSIAGLHHFRDYGSYIDDLKAGRSVIIDNVWKDPRTRGQADTLVDLGISSFLNMPIMEHGQLAAIAMVHFERPHAWTPEEEAFVRAAADRTQVAVARLRAEERQAVLNGEISHRLKNTLAMVQALSSQTLKDAIQPEALSAFNQRLVALGRAHDVLLKGDWEAADLGEVAKTVLISAGAEGRFSLNGPHVALGPRATLSTSLLLHELTTNALKYGALTKPNGRVTLCWRVEGEAPEAELVVEWAEQGGPPAVAPTRKGFGSRLLKMGLVGAGGSRIDYGTNGLAASFRAPVGQVEQA